MPTAETASTPANEAITHLFSDWLRAEVVSSHDDNNAVLNDYDKWAETSILPYDDLANIGSQKSLSHHDRLEKWTKNFEEEPNDRDATMHQLFAVLMGLSGAFREQCLVNAANADDYMARRYGQNPHGLFVADQVNKKLTDYYGNPLASDSAIPVIDTDKLIDDTRTVNKQRYEGNKLLYQQKRIFGLRRAVYGARLMLLRQAWLDVGIDYVLHTANLEGGDISKVPVLEPKSITYAKVVYPFAKEPPYFSSNQ